MEPLSWAKARPGLSHRAPAAGLPPARPATPRAPPRRLRSCPRGRGRPRCLTKGRKMAELNQDQPEKPRKTQGKSYGDQWIGERENSGNHGFSHEIWGFPVIFPLNQSIETKDHLGFMENSGNMCRESQKSSDWSGLVWKIGPKSSGCWFMKTYDILPVLVVANHKRAGCTGWEPFLIGEYDPDNHQHNIICFLNPALLGVS